VRFRDKLFWARLYVLAFVICLVAPAALITIVRPQLAFSDQWPPSPTRFAARVIILLLLGASCLVAALGIEPRIVRWLASMVLSVELLRHGYMQLGAWTNWSEALFFLVMSFPFVGGPLSVGIWLCFPRFHSSPDQPETGPSVAVLRRER
jgi:hypothetical protein